MGVLLERLRGSVSPVSLWPPPAAGCARSVTGAAPCPRGQGGAAATGVLRATRKLRGAGGRARIHPPSCPAAIANEREARSCAAHAGSRSRRRAAAVWRRAVPRTGDVASVT
ncbi:unnamed protein product [Coccothraustes coccothraustes]